MLSPLHAPPMSHILIVTNSGDIHSDDLVRACVRLGVECSRYNTDHVRVRGAVSSFAQDGTSIDIDGRHIDLSAIDVLIYRRPLDVSAEMIGNPIKPWVLSFLNQEWGFLERSFPCFIRGVTINPPATAFHAQNKWVQLRAARNTGLNVPEALVANEVGSLRSFVAHSACVTKAIGNGSHLYGGLIRSGTTVDASTSQFPDGYKAFTLSLVQRTIFPSAMWRIVTIGNRSIGFRLTGKVLTIERDSRLVEDQLDGMCLPVPPDTEVRLHAMMKNLGIIYASSDFIEDASGHLWFIDLNPEGQWGAYEQRFNVPISEIIIEEAVRLAG